jgi:hypothetical protein
VNNFIVQQHYSPGGPKPTGEDENRVFAVVCHRDFNFTRPNQTLKNMNLGKSMSQGLKGLWKSLYEAVKFFVPAQFIYQYKVDNKTRLLDLRQ